MAINNQQVSFDDEMLILVDNEDNVIGYADKLSCHQGDGILHRAFSIFIFNSDKKLLLQKRSEQKQLWPLIWANSCCSHPRKGEDLSIATRRRLKEELGLAAPLRHLFTFKYHAKYKDVGSEKEMCAVFIGCTDQSVHVNPNEIADTKWVSIDELTEAIAANPENFSPWLKLEWARLMRDHRADIEALFN